MTLVPKFLGICMTIFVHISASVCFFPRTSACDFSLFLFRDECLQMAVACFVLTAENHLKIYVCDSYHSLHSWVQSLFEKTLRVTFVSRVLLWNQAEMTLSGTFLAIEPCLDFFLSLFFSPSFPWEQLLTSFPGNISL